MTKNLWPLLFAVAAVACGSDEVERTSQETAPSVEASIASVSLASDCPDTETKDAERAGLCAAEPCTTFCDQTSMHMTFVSERGEGAATSKVTVTAVRLLDADTGEVLDELTARAPAIWMADTYSPWDGQLTSANVKALYKLSAPDWNTVGTDWNASFILEVDLEIDGAKITVRSDPVQREPLVAT